VGAAKTAPSASRRSAAPTSRPAASTSRRARPTSTRKAPSCRQANIALDAARDIHLVAAQNTAETHGSNSGSSLGFGFTAGVGSQNGISFQISASRSQGQSNGSETHYDNTLITATDTLEVRSGGDTHLIFPAFGQSGGGVQHRVITPSGQSTRINVDYLVKNEYLIK
jgi:hypothetical protein